MFKCKECGNLFENGEDARWVEKHGLDTPPYEKYTGCPICKGSYEEVEPCKICGAYAEEMNDGFCKQCSDKVQKRFRDLMEQFTKNERELLNLLYEGERI